MSFFTGYPCEQAYWHGYSDDIDGIAEPVSACSGLVLCWFALCGMPRFSVCENDVQLPVEYYLAKASLFICGIGTILYHVLDRGDDEHGHVNTFLYDGVTMAFVVMNVCLLYCTASNMLVAFLAAAYIMFWIMSNDSVTYSYLQGVFEGMIIMCVQYPSFVLPFAFLFGLNLTSIKQSRVPLVMALLVAVSAWLIDRFACNDISALAFGHAVWHCFVGYAADLFIVIGLKVRLENDPKNNLFIKGNWWPTLEKKAESKQHETAFLKLSF